MEQKYLIDTNVISHLFWNTLPDKRKEFLKKSIQFLTDEKSKHYADYYAI
jgi:TRAP-type C4-dicarboxylate transport system substrate-binding protein